MKSNKFIVMVVVMHIAMAMILIACIAVFAEEKTDGKIAPKIESAQRKIADESVQDRLDQLKRLPENSN